MQVLLIRHALPHRTRPGEGSDPELTEDGWQQARRLPAALDRFGISRLVSSPQRRAFQTAQPVAHALGLCVDIDDRLAEYDHGASQYLPIEQVRTERPEDWKRMTLGELPDAVEAESFRGRIRCALTDVIAAASHADTVAVFSHGGVINAVLHEILGTDKLLSFPIDYASVTLLRYSRTGDATVAGVNGVDHVWDLLPRTRQRRGAR